MTLRRYTTLNHLAQAAKALLQNTQQINQMLTDLNRVDFRTVQVCTKFFLIEIFFIFISLVSFKQQASWICQCDDETINNFEKEFKKNLQNKSSVEDWAKWLDVVVTSSLEKYEGTDRYAKMAHQFLLKWSFYW
jgi:regulatory factor X 1/2/3